MGLLDARKKAAARQQDNGKLPKGSLGALRKKKAAGALGRMRQQRLLSSKADFKDNGLVYHNAHVSGRTASGRPIGTVDVSNGDKTFTFHNRFGAWFHDVKDDKGKHEGKMKEAATFEITYNLQGRFDRELKLQGIPTAAELAEKERQKAEEQRKRLAKLEADRKKKKAAAAKKADTKKGAIGKARKGKK